MNIQLFSQNLQKEKEQVNLESYDVSSQIRRFAPEVILSCENDKLYIDDGYIFQSYSDFFLFLNNGEQLNLPKIKKDDSGYFILLPKGKFFKLVCNECQFEWEGGALTVWCPNCGSLDWRIKRNI
jgi:ribosomal protein S27E